MRPKLLFAAAGALTLALTGAHAQSPDPVESCALELVVLGAGQDAGAPQIGNWDDSGPRLLPSSLGLIDRANGKRYLLDATPAITEQLAMLDAIEPPREGLGVDGVFLTHAHIGHYLGLAYFGREAAGANGIPIFAMPRMAAFLRSNGPWDQLVSLENIAISEMADGAPAMATDTVMVMPFLFPHRDEYSETVGFGIFTAERRALYLPDLDSWEAAIEMRGPDGDIRGAVSAFDYIFVDATFWDDNELVDENGVGRDMSEIPHPRVSGTMDLLADLSDEDRAKFHFIHYNHTNPIRDPDSAESREVIERGFNVARRGDSHCMIGAE